MAKLVIDYDYDFEVLALISSVKDYKLAFNINKALKINLCRSEDLCIEFLKEGKLLISHYLFETEHNCLRLLKNKSLEYSNVSKPYLLPELKNYDYFVHLSGEGMKWEADEVTDKLRSLPVIQYVQKLDIQSLKSKENLIF